MILETSNKKYAGNSIRLGNNEYTFNKEGKFEERDDKLAKELIEKYPFIWEEGKIEKPKVETKKASDPADQETINDLTIKLEMTKSTIESKNKKINELKEENALWRQKAGEAIQGKVENVEVLKEEIEASDLKTELETKDLETLKAILKEMGGELRGLKTEDQVIEKILALDKQNKE